MSKPWYRHFWVWFTLAPLIATVAASMVTLFLAGSPPALVVDEFGAIAMVVEQDQRRLRRAAELGMAATVDVAGTGPGSRVTVRLEGPAPPALRLALVHPTLATLDRATDLVRDGDAWRGVVERADTRLYVQLGDAAGDWRITGELPRGADAVRLAPAAPP